MTDSKNISGRIVFMGTPEFAVSSLQTLVESNQNVVGVVTVADKPSGRGQKISVSPVKKAALELSIPVFQPTSLKDPDFIDQLKELQADLFIVVAFRMLPEIVWTIPKFGTFNLHASLLPQYRGAAPINWAIINGEQETGITTFFINHEIDTGHILLQERLPISPTMSAGQLHDKLMKKGAELVNLTTQKILSKTIKPEPQNVSISSELKPAPKLFKKTCRLDWTNDAHSLFNKIRGLSPYPAATTRFITEDNKSVGMKIFEARIISDRKIEAGVIESDRHSLCIGTGTEAIEILQIQPEGKKKMSSADLIRGLRTRFSKAD